MSTPASQLPFLPQQLPQTQAQWQQVVNILQQWQTPLNGLINSSFTPSFTAPTLLNGWVNSPGFNPAGFYEDQNGRVWLRGAVQGGANNTPIFNLPGAASPQYAQTFSLVATNGIQQQIGFINISAAGVISISGISLAPTLLISLDGLSFSLSP